MRILNVLIIALVSSNMINAHELQMSDKATVKPPGSETITGAWNTAATQGTGGGQCKAICQLPAVIDVISRKRGHANARSSSRNQYPPGDR